MAITPITTATKPITTKGLYNAAGTNKTYEDWQKSATPGSPMPSIAPAQVDDFVANKVTEITKQDSPMMQAAATEGLKIANRRGLLNSSIAAGASQGAALDRALPIASQDASQDFQRNSAARNFEYGMASQDSSQASQAAMQKTEIGYQQAERKLDRTLQEKLASWNLKSSDRNAAAQSLYQMETLYSSAYQSIMQNTALSAAGRTAQLTSAKNLRDRQLNLTEQLYNIDLIW